MKSFTQSNFVKERFVLQPGVSSKSQADQLTAGNAVKQITRFVDGLGRPLQEVDKQAVPDGAGGFADLITPHIYDNTGRESKRYLPFSLAGNNGGFATDAVTKQTSFYNGILTGEQNYYAESVFESSPLNRVLKTMPQGKRWVGNSVGTGKEYAVNLAAENVYKWKLTYADQSGVGITVTNNTNGTRRLTYTWPNNSKLSGVVIRYKELNNPYWQDRGGSTTSPRVMDIAIGDAEYQINLIFPNTPNVVIPIGSEFATATLANDGVYDEAKLFKLVSTDEDGRKVIEYRDFDGNIVLKKVQKNAAAGDGHADWLCTYYVYDDFGQLRYVLPPKAIEAYLNGKALSEFQDALCYRYEYDRHGRMVVNKLPGAAEERFVYDVKGRLVLSQDGELRKAKSWKFFQYDNLDRETVTGIISDPEYYNSHAIHIEWANTVESYPVLAHYTAQILKENYYDDYGWAAGGVGGGLDGEGINNAAYFTTTPGVAPQYAESVVASKQTRGLLTGSKTAIIGVADKSLYSAYYYDLKDRLIQTQSTNLSGGKDIKTDQYSFSGQVLNTLTRHAYAGTANPQNYNVGYKRDFDLAGKVSKTTVTISKMANGAAVSTVSQQVAANSYDKLGRLLTKALGTNLESLTYDYNVRGWVSGINRAYVSGAANHYFGEEIAYDDVSSLAPGAAYTKSLLNGDISGVTWRSKGDGVRRKYDFTYDLANRLTGAAFVQNASGTTWNNTLIDYSVSGIVYDANGNLKQMTQKGYIPGGSVPLDQLTYTYANNDLSNQIQQIHDAANNENSALGDFRYKGTKPLGTTTDYQYDENGSLVSDNNKLISSIAYSAAVKLPVTYTVSGKGTVEYIYDADGVKLQKKVTDANGIVSTTDYSGLFVYQTIARSPVNTNDPNQTLQYIVTEDGRIRPVTSQTRPFAFDYFLKDHLGNNRVVLTDEVKQVNNIPAATFEKGAGGSLPAYYTVSNYNNITANGNIPSFINRPADNNYPNNNGITNPETDASLNTAAQSGFMYKIPKAAARQSDVGITLKVSSGDVVSLFARSYYFSNSVNSTNTNLMSNVLNNFVSSFTGSAGFSAIPHATNAAASLSTAGSPLNTSLASALNALPYTAGTTPRAGINWILFDDQLNAVATNSGAIDVGQGESGKVNPWSRSVNISKSGYLYVFCSNESTNIDVYFDNLQLTVNASPLLEETHYYPFGLTMAAISSKAANRPANQLKFNEGTELQQKEFSDGSGLELYATDNRGYDPQIGRFWQIDPLADAAEDISPYVYANNNPVLLNDPFGLFADSTDKKGNVWHELPPVRVISGTTYIEEDQIQSRFSANKASAIGGAIPLAGLGWAGSGEAAAGIAAGAAVPVLVTFAAVAATYAIVKLDGLARKACAERWYITYVKFAKDGSNTVYVGRCSGTGSSPEEVLYNYDRRHRMRDLFQPAVMDRYISGSIFVNPAVPGFASLGMAEVSGYAVTRGREQQVYDHYKLQGYQMGNSINPVWKYNPYGFSYWTASSIAFGPLEAYGATY